MVTELKAIYISYGISIFLMLEAGIITIEGMQLDPNLSHPAIGGMIGVIGLLATIVLCLQMSNKFIGMSAKRRQWIHPFERIIDFAVLLSLGFWIYSVSQGTSYMPIICTMTLLDLKVAILFAHRFYITETSWSLLMTLLPETISFLLMSSPAFSANLPLWLTRLSLTAVLIFYGVICTVTRQKTPWVDYSITQVEHPVLSEAQKVPLVFGYFVIGINISLIATAGAGRITTEYTPYLIFMYILQIVAVVLTEIIHYRRLRKIVTDLRKR